MTEYWQQLIRQLFLITSLYSSEDVSTVILRFWSDRSFRIICHQLQILNIQLEHGQMPLFLFWRQHICVTLPCTTPTSLLRRNANTEPLGAPPKSATIVLQEEKISLKAIQFIGPDRCFSTICSVKEVWIRKLEAVVVTKSKNYMISYSRTHLR